jgi:hypothetical protein
MSQSGWVVVTTPIQVNSGGTKMRTILIAAVTAAGIGLLGTSASFAAPASGTMLRDLTAQTSNTQSAYCRWWRRCWHQGWSRRWCRTWNRCW